MIETMTADICLNAFTVAATAVAEAMSKSKKPRRKVVDAASLDPMAHGHKNTTQSTGPDLPKLVSMADVRTDGGTQARMTINETIVKDYADALEDGAKLPPVVLYYDENADVYWLADGFHRFEAHRMVGRVAISAFVKDGTQRDAKLHAAGANATHGLPRTREDKRCAVTMLLQDPEWVQWSDNAIAKACHVSNHLVADVRASLTLNSPSDTERTYTTKHGTTATMRTAKVGKAGPAPAPEHPVSPANLIETEPTIATRLSPKQGEVAVTEMDALREEVADLKADLAELLAENEHMARVFEADAQIKAALAEVARFQALAENAERTLAARSHEFNERARNVVYWKNRAEKAEKLLAKTEATGGSSALRAENAELRAQLGGLAEQFEGTLAEAESMRKVIEADDGLAEAVKRLKQVQELNRVLETRLHGLVNEKNEVLRRYKGAQHELDKLKQAHAELSAHATTLMVNGAGSASGDAAIVNAELTTLRAENGGLRAQLGDLALQLKEAMVCYDEMHAILETSVPLDEVPRQLKQALELARMWESRIADAPSRHADAHYEQDGGTQSAEDEAVVHGEHFTGLTGTEPPEC